MSGLALLASLTGGALAVRAGRLPPGGSAELEGLRMHVERAVWLHEPTDHGGAATLPALPGVPAPGQRRLVVEFTVFNPRGRPLDFTPRELRLTEEDTGRQWRPSSEAPVPVRLKPAQWLTVTSSFDVPPTSSALRLDWTRGAERSTLLSTRRPPAPGAGRSGWPQRVEELPPGNAAAGSALYQGRLACPVCHGAPEAPDRARIAPALGELARVGATRVPGKTLAQYVYESLLDPNAFIVPECTDRMPCARPSTMPLYGEVLSAQEMADLIRYLVSLREET